MLVKPLPRPLGSFAKRQADACRVLHLDVGECADPHPAARLWVVVRGHAQVTSSLGQFNLSRGQYLALESASRPQLHAGAGSVTLCLDVGAGVLAAWREHPSRPLTLLGRGEIGHRGLRTAFRLWRSAREGGEQARTVACPAEVQRIHRLLHDIEQPSQRQVDACPGQSQRRRRQIYLRMQRARLQFDGNQERVIRVADIAQASNFSLWYFTKIFHLVYGITPQRYAADARLALACALLGQGVLSISDVAAASGFENPCSFARAFRMRYGVTASCYRERLRKGERTLVKFGGRGGAA